MPCEVIGGMCWCFGAVLGACWWAAVVVVVVVVRCPSASAGTAASATSIMSTE